MDTKSGRYQSEVVQISISNAGFSTQQILKTAQNRVSIYFGGQPGSAIQYSPSSTAAGHQSVNIPTSVSGMVMHKEDIGEIINSAWYANADSAGNFGVIVIAVYDVEMQ